MILHLVVVDVLLVLVVEPDGVADARLLPPLVDVFRGPLDEGGRDSDHDVEIGNFHN